MTRRVLAVLLLMVAAIPLPASADPGHERPKITEFRFLQPPLKSGIDEVLKVEAHDPDSWISEVQVQWMDDAENGGVLFAHTYCVQDPDYSDPGTPAILKVPVFFDHPGTYHVEVRAISEIECQGGNDTRTSATLEKDVTVTDPLKTMSDPDDMTGALDVAGMEQTQESSMTSATTEIVHRLTMFEPWGNDALAGNAFMEMYLDIDDDPASVERVITIDLDEEDSTLWASMIDATTGQSRGYARVRRPDDKTLEVRFPPTMVRKGLRSYRWYALVDGAAESCPEGESCIDTIPDTGSMRHRL